MTGQNKPELFNTSKPDPLDRRRCHQNHAEPATTALIVTNRIVDRIGHWELCADDREYDSARRLISSKAIANGVVAPCRFT